MRRKKKCSVAVGVWLVWSFHLHTDVVGLVLGQLSHLGTEGWQVQAGNLLVQLLGQQVHLVLVGLGLLGILQDIKLSQHLVSGRCCPRWHCSSCSSCAPT